MISISMCMIVKNEQDILARCLDSYAGTYDELIIVDTGSTDNTKEIAAHYTDKIYDFEWINDFQPQEILHFPKLDVTTYSVLTQTKCLMIPTTTH